MGRPYVIVDTFTDEHFGGNAAAVVLETEGLTEPHMQALAAEFNLSETTFVLPPSERKAHARFRWFTPSLEVQMCGHATIAGVHALVESGRWELPQGKEAEPFQIETASGVLSAGVESYPGTSIGQLIWLDLPQPRLSEKSLSTRQLAEAFNLPVDAFPLNPAPALTQDDDLIVLVNDFMELNEARLDREKLLHLSQRHELRGVCLATVNTVTPSLGVQSRFFAPACGVDEDPVTGSVHGPLAAYLVQQRLIPLQGDRVGIMCVQAIPGGRTGLIRALVRYVDRDRYAVRIAGQAITTMRGELVE